VCVPPSPELTYLKITVKGDNSSSDNCSIEPCLNNNCTCRNIFAYAACGTLSIPLTVFIKNWVEIPTGDRIILNNHQYVAGWLNTLGLTSVQTLLKDLSIIIDESNCYSCPGEIQPWAINIFPRLEVVRGTLNFHFLKRTSSLLFALLPGSGLAKLRATGKTTFTASDAGPGGWAMVDLSFLSGLVCPGTQIDASFVSNLGSLTGLERVVDGNPALANQTCFIGFTFSQSVLFNVSALAPFAGCGGRQRPDNSSFLPCLNVWSGQINTWTALCNYIASGNLSPTPAVPMAECPNTAVPAPSLPGKLKKLCIVSSYPWHLHFRIFHEVVTPFMDSMSCYVGHSALRVSKQDRVTSHKTLFQKTSTVLSSITTT
jgi:hypothetical protein